MNPTVVLPSRYRHRFVAHRAAEAMSFRWSFAQAYALCLSLLAILGVYYVWILNANATKGYDYRTLDQMRRELLLQQNLLGVTLAEFESLDKLSTDAQQRKMEQVDAPDYLVAKQQDLDLAMVAAPHQAQ